ncbi:MAG: flagellar hook-basal body protein [SAR324 cluster bacterium]|nr:flagellar hook-basal body protein [SAR324 cluster bacterium]
MNPQGIYTLVSYGKSLERQMEAVANNLANVETAGYKGDQPAFQSVFAQTMGVPSMSDEEVFAHHEHLAPYTGVGTFYVSIADMGKNMGQGRLQQTGQQLDLALANPNGFFSINTPQGERFTRGGSFHLNQDKQLVTTDGYLVNGKHGAIIIEGGAVEVSEDGSIIVDGKNTGGLKIVTFPFPDRLQKLGNSLMAPVGEENNARILEDVDLVQGSLEKSNVDSFREMVRMIQANRSYTSMQKALGSADEMNQRAISLAEV